MTGLLLNLVPLTVTAVAAGGLLVLQRSGLLDLLTVLGVVVAAVVAVAVVSAWFGLWPAAAFLVAVLGICVTFVAVTASRVRAARRRGAS